MRAQGRRLAWSVVLLAVCFATPVAATNGHLLHAVGAVDAALGGATNAAPQDVVGALYHNVGSLTQITGTRVDVNLEIFHNTRHVRSTLGGKTGRTESETDLALIPAFGVSHRHDGITYFLGAMGISGFGVDYPEDAANPILRTQVEDGRNTGGFGHAYSFYQLLRVSGGLAVEPFPDFSIGFAPALGYATLGVEPFGAASPDCTTDGVCAYPSASNQVAAIGGGFLAGVHYRLHERLHVGAGYTSPMWFTKFRWNSSVANPELETFGEGRRFGFRLDVPQRVDLGVALYPLPDWLLLASATWINYANTRGFDDEGFDSAGRVRGFGFDDIWVAGVGAQYRAFSWLTTRIGYNYSENPVPDRLSFFDLFAPTLVQHHVTVGLGLPIGDAIELNLAYYHTFPNDGSGPFVSPVSGPVPDSMVRNEYGTQNSVSLQIAFKL